MARVRWAWLGVVLVLLLAGPALAQQQPDAPAAQPPVPVRVVEPTLPSPLPVTIVEAPKSGTQLDAEQRDRAERRTLYDQLLVFAALLVAVVAFLAIAFALQTFYLGLGLRAIRRSALHTEHNMRAAQRAFIYVSSVDWAPAGTDLLRVSPIWANGGTTATKGLRISTNWKASHGELPPDFDINYTRPPESLFLGPGGKAEFGAIAIPMRDIQAAIEARLHLYVWGRATYHDLFQGSQQHYFDFCHRVEASGSAPDGIVLRFTQFGLSNGSDEDRQPADERD